MILKKNRCTLDYLSFLLVTGWESKYESVDMLLRHLSRKSRSEASKELYLRNIHSFCVCVGLNPDQLIKLPKNQIENLLQAYTDERNNGKYSIRYLNTILNVLKLFFKVNGFKAVNTLEVEGYYMPARYRKFSEYIPTKNELYFMADSATSLRDRAIILALYSSGLRNSTLRALLYRDVKEELLKNFYNLFIPVYPEMKLIDPNACKNSIPYYSFTCDEATHAIKLYILERERRSGEINDTEPLFTSEYNQIPRSERRLKTLSSREVQIVIKDSAKRAGIGQWRNVCPKCLRKSFETVLRSGLIDGGQLDPKVQEFFMGHILPGSQDTYFDKTKIEAMRALYSQLKFGRVPIENKFKILREAVAKAFEGTGFDPDRVMEEYLAARWESTSPHNEIQ